MTGWLVYHPARMATVIDGTKVHYDSTSHNQDPYVWNRRFLHTYCHITQMTPQVGDIEFWVSGNAWPTFTSLFCDLVLVIETKVYWTERNRIVRFDPLVDSDAAFVDHYRWASDHPFARRARYTLKGDPEASFQPQNEAGELLDVVPLLSKLGVHLSELRTRLRAGFSSQPMRLDSSVSRGLYDQIAATAAVRLSGDELESVRARHPELASQ